MKAKPRLYTIGVRVSRDEQRLLGREARRWGVPVSAYVRAVAVRDASSEKQVAPATSETANALIEATGGRP